MKHLKTAAFVLVCLSIGVALGLGVGKLIKQYRHPVIDATPRPGAGDAPALRGFFYAGVSPSAYDNLPSLHATAIAIEYNDNSQALAASVQHAHSLGLRVILLPSPIHSDKNPFPQPLPAIAAAAQAAKFDALCISWLNSDPDPAYWQSQIADVRRAFTGQLILAATPDILPGIEFIDQADLIAAIAPFDLPLPKKHHLAGLHEYRNAWACYLDSIESIAARYGKKALLLDILATDAAATASPADSIRAEALVTETKGRSAIAGVILSATAVNDPQLLQRISALWLTNAPSTKPAAEPMATDPDSDTDP